MMESLYPFASATFLLCWFLASVSYTSSQDLLNSCLDSRNHKKQPGPESSLYEECTPWKNHACCTQNTTYSVHNSNMYNFNFDHCQSHNNEKLSSKCKRHFIQDLCFYECEPHIGPWKIPVKRSFAKERFFNVPLCRSDCESWFDACRDDYTCVANWPKQFTFSNGHNKCPKNSSCVTFAEMYNTAENFCQTVWDGSWKVVNDSEPCMRMWFNGSLGNPNKRVAEVKIQQTGGSKATATTSPAICVTLVAFLLIKS